KKINKERLTLALCANADGTDKMIPFVIAWITVLLFQKWLKKFDLKMASRNVILLMNNAKVHFVGILLLVQDNNEEPTTYNNDNDIMEELYNNIELLNLQNVMDLEDYIDYSEERIEPQQVESDKEDNSVETLQITHKEALDAIYRLELYFIQQDLNYVVQTENDIALSKLYELARKIRNASFKQLNIETFFELV
ncbi:9516_t:CDS:2, partial [Dentiscutata erythropus]